jgi:tetratricopeptide (TPR) repeat protein
VSVVRKPRSGSHPTPLDGSQVLRSQPDNWQHIAPGDVLGERYRLLKLLGRGGNGVVYEAEDIQSPGDHVAVKLLSRERALALYQLKNEFRSLADVRHPNLVRLHQLASDRGRMFLVMDLVSGTDFARFVNPTGQRFEETRLRLALPQVLAGIAAIHVRGKVHRDLKPNNVLVTPEGRVVIIDFGLVENEREGGIAMEPNAFVGTPAYAAPEQVQGKACGPAADLYAVGVMLYEALTGAIPFGALGLGVMLKKVEEDPPPPADAPADLAELAMKLLARDPEQRPTAAEALVRLGISTVQDEATPITGPILLGRESELALLSSALRDTSTGEPVLVLLHGPSGIGKSTLTRHFTEQARREGALLLHGRCYAREQMPYKAFDGLVDQLARHLALLPDAEREALLPADLPLLARVFSVLERFVASDAPLNQAALLDAMQVRERAFGALKQLLCRLGAARKLIVLLDDLHWGDADSASLLQEMLTPPGAPAAMFLCVYRGDERRTSPMLQRLFEESTLPLRTIDIQLRPLEARDAETLARTLLPETTSRRDLDKLLAESRGSPFLLLELSRLVRRGKEVAVEALVAHRLAELDPHARRLLELVSLAGHPLPLGVTLSTAGSGVGPLLELLSAQLVRLRIGDDGERIEPYHDRVREVVVDNVPERSGRRTLRHLARTYERTQPDDVDVLMELWRRVGDMERAALFAARCAEQAEHALAFERAADLYAFALEHGPADELASLEAACARACANAGRVREAGERFERAAMALPDGKERRELLRKAMLYTLTAGDIVPGERILRALCEEIGVRTPPRNTVVAVLFAWWLYFVYVSGKRLRNLTVPPPPPDEPAEGSVADEQLEVRFMAAQGLGHHSMVQSSVFVMEGLLETRDKRRPQYWPRALVWEAHVECVADGVARPASNEAVERALALAEERCTVQEHALVLASAGARDVYLGRLAQAETALTRAEQLLREQGYPVLSACNFTRSGRLAVWHASGSFDRVLAHADRWLIEARLLGDPFGALVVHVMGSHRFLALDDVEGARDSLKALSTEVGRRSLYVADPWWQVDVELYAGEVQRALDLVRAARRHSLQLAMESTSIHRAWLAFTEARAALACMARGIPQRRLAKRALRRLEKQGYVPAAAQALQVRAALAHASGDDAGAARLLGEAAERFEAVGFVLYAAAARYRLGQLRGGEEGRALVELSLAACAQRSVKNPERWLATLAPGFERAS